MLYMVTFTINIQKMLAFFYQHHGSVMGFPELRSSVNFRGLRPRDPSAAFGASSSSEWGVSESRWEMLEVPNQDFKPFKNWFHGYISCLFLLYASIYIYIYTSRYITYILVIFHVNLCIYIYTFNRCRSMSVQIHRSHASSPPGLRGLDAHPEELPGW
jgi:hypothetical protein